MNFTSFCQSTRIIYVAVSAINSTLLYGMVRSGTILDNTPTSTVFFMVTYGIVQEHTMNTYQHQELVFLYFRVSNEKQET
jgi:hypothetical protein